MFYGVQGSTVSLRSSKTFVKGHQGCKHFNILTPICLRRLQWNAILITSKCPEHSFGDLYAESESNLSRLRHLRRNASHQVPYASKTNVFGPSRMFWRRMFTYSVSSGLHIGSYHLPQVMGCRRYTTSNSESDEKAGKGNPEDRTDNTPAGDLALESSRELSDRALSTLRTLLIRRRKKSISLAAKKVPVSEWKSEDWKPEDWKDEWSNVANPSQSHAVDSTFESKDLQAWTSGTTSSKVIPRSILARIRPTTDKLRRGSTRLSTKTSEASIALPRLSKSTTPVDDRTVYSRIRSRVRERLRQSKLLVTGQPATVPKKPKKAIMHPLFGRTKIFGSGSLDKFAADDILTDIEVDASNSRPIAQLQHGLDRVLFNQTVHWLQDPHSGVFNFPPLLQTLPAVTEFAFERLPSFQGSSQDSILQDLVAKHSKRFVGTTSSLTRILSHIYYLLSDDKMVDTSKLSMAFVNMSRKFTTAARASYSFSLVRKEFTTADGTIQDFYAVDAGLGEDPRNERDSELNVLLWMGTMMEKFLTYSPEQFAHLLRKNPISPEGIDTRREAYRYSKSSKFILRSQLDCHDPRLPGTGVFDVKTRAVLPVRLDQLNIHENVGYRLRTLTGEFESFEREYYDLIRSAFLKYNFQARIGAMDGIFVAYHNTQQQFGFQYVPVTAMEAAIYGSQNPDAGRLIFHRCLEMMEVILESIVSRFPGESLCCTIRKSETDNSLVVWANPVNCQPNDGVIELFRVNASHLLNGQSVDGRAAIESVDQSWTVGYEIQQSTMPRANLWKSVQSAIREAKYFPLYLPDGVSGSEATKRLALVNYGAGIGLNWDPEDRMSMSSLDDRNVLTGYRPLVDKFPSIILHLRDISRRGQNAVTKEANANLLEPSYEPQKVSKPTVSELARSPPIIFESSSSSSEHLIFSSEEFNPITGSSNSESTLNQPAKSSNRHPITMDEVLEQRKQTGLERVLSKLSAMQMKKQADFHRLLLPRSAPKIEKDTTQEIHAKLDSLIGMMKRRRAKFVDTRPVGKRQSLLEALSKFARLEESETAAPGEGSSSKEKDRAR